MDENSYREHPRTGTTPGPEGSDQRPATVDPSVLTDDREKADLLVFEKTWGHRMLAGLGFAMIVVALVIVIYAAIRVASYASLLMGEGGFLASGFVLYGAVLVAGLVMVPPAVVAIWVSRRPEHVNVAIVLAIVALAAVVAFVGYALAVAGTAAAVVLVYGALLALLPVLYLVAALKIRRSQTDAD